MSLGSRITFGFRNLLRSRNVESELDEEMRSYIALLTDEYVKDGMPLSDARRKALAECGGIELLKQGVRAQRTGIYLEILWQDVRYGVRQLVRNPGFTWTAVVTLGLGIGATTAIFSAVYSLLLHPLPYKDSRQLVTLAMVWPDSKADSIISPDFVATQTGAKSFEQFAGYAKGDDNLTGTGEPVKVSRASVTANFFTALGVVPQLGRTFSAGEDRNGGAPVIVLSDRLWRNHFNADRDVIGKTAVLNGKTKTIIGVLPRHFSFPDFAMEPDYYAPPPLESDGTVSIEKPVWPMTVVARLRSGVSIQQAQSEMQAFFEARAKTYPVQMVKFGEHRNIVVESLQRHITGHDRVPLYILLASVATVLLVACANIANLQLARSVSRRHETALRGALGASRMRLLRQFLTESAIVSVLAAALGLVIAFLVTYAVRRAGMLDGTGTHSDAWQLVRLPFGKLSNVIELDGWVLSFAVGLAFVTTLLFGLAPAISGTRTDLRGALQLAAMRITSGREQRFLRHSLLIVEVALAVALLASAGLLVRSFVNVLHYDSGFNPSNTLVGNTLISDQSDDTQKRPVPHFLDELLPRLRALPGVKAAAIASALPLEATYQNSALAFEGVPLPPIGEWPVLSMISITPDYFRVVGTPIVKGRAFGEDDREGAQPVVIVNRSFANRYFAGKGLGKRFKANIGGKTAYDFKTWTIVGISDDVRHGGIESELVPEAFLPMDQSPQGSLSIALRTEGDPLPLADALRQAVTATDHAQPVFNLESMKERVSDATARRRLIMLLIASFAVLAVLLSAVGVYGVFAYSVNQRSQEMGIRLALGASREGLLRLIVTQAARLIATGGFLGIGSALLLSKLLKSMLIGVTSHDALSFSLAWMLMTLVALAASMIPATRAARIDLNLVLRSE